MHLAEEQHARAAKPSGPVVTIHSSGTPRSAAANTPVCTVIVPHAHAHTLSELQAFEQPGNGRVLVVDGGGSKRCALLGDNIAEMAHKNGWSVSPCTAPPAPAPIAVNAVAAALHDAKQLLR